MSVTGHTGVTGSVIASAPAWPSIIDIQQTKTGLTVKGNADFEKSVTIQGDLLFKEKSIKTLLENIEERLAILTFNSELESKWEELKDLGNRYRSLEKEILEKEKMWATLKK
jgi:hypothetical protein